jgi:hypothetical protein
MAEIGQSPEEIRAIKREKVLAMKKEQSAKYYSDPFYRAKHLAYVSEKITCPACKKLVTRSHMTRHRRNPKHQPFQEQYEKEKAEKDRQEQLTFYENMLKRLQSELGVKN